MAKKKDSRKLNYDKGAIPPNSTKDFSCQGECMAEFSVTNEPHKDDSYPHRTVLFCPFCGSERIDDCGF